MGFGIFKKIKQGITKIADFGKKTLKKIADNAPKIIDTAQKVIDLGRVDGMLDKLNIDKNKLTVGLNKADNAVNSLREYKPGGVNFAGRSWIPQIKR